MPASPPSCRRPPESSVNEVDCLQQLMEDSVCCHASSTLVAWTHEVAVPMEEASCSPFAAVVNASVFVVRHLLYVVDCRVPKQKNQVERMLAAIPAGPVET